MSGESLSAHSFSDVPKFGWGITGPRHKAPGIWSKGQAHDIPSVSSECGCLLASFNVPQSAASRKKKRVTRVLNYMYSNCRHSRSFQFGHRSIFIHLQYILFFKTFVLDPFELDNYEGYKNFSASWGSHKLHCAWVYVSKVRSISAAIITVQYVDPGRYRGASPKRKGLIRNNVLVKAQEAGRPFHTGVLLLCFSRVTQAWKLFPI